MKIIKKESSAAMEVKGSKFYSFLIPYSDYKLKIEELKNNHPKARHFVYAYRHLNELGQIVENQSDDGEPRGSSGRPILNVLRGNDLINTAIIIVRYFGGTKLGVGGLVRAYTESANLAINHAVIESYKKMVSHSITVNYRDVGSIEHLLKHYPDSMWEKKFEEKFVEICFNVCEEMLEEILQKSEKFIIHGA